MRQILTILFFLVSSLSYSEDTTFLKIHFLYGSKPLKKYKDTETKWFGGLLGGHVGIESGSDSIVNFMPSGKFHWFAKKNNKHSAFSIHTADKFYAILGGNLNEAKKAIVSIPITTNQKHKFDSITTVYLKHTPYDYAFFGMRCGAATYEILGQLGIFPTYPYAKTYKKIFYPKKLRKRVFKKAVESGWGIVKQEGSFKRKWEQD